MAQHLNISKTHRKAWRLRSAAVMAGQRNYSCRARYRNLGGRASGAIGHSADQYHRGLGHVSIIGGIASGRLPK